MILRYFGYQWRVIDDFLRQIGANRCETAHKWAETFLSGDFEAFLEDGRGGRTQVEPPAGHTRPVKSRLRQSKRQYMINLRPETGRILPVWYRQYYGRIMPCSIRSDTTVVNGETRNVLPPYFNVMRSHFNVYNRK